MEHEGALKSKLKTKVLYSISSDASRWQEDNDEIENIRKEIKEGETRFVNDEGLIRTNEDKIWIPLNNRIEFIKDCHLKLCHAGFLKCIKYIETDFDIMN